MNKPKRIRRKLIWLPPPPKSKCPKGTRLLPLPDGLFTVIDERDFEKTYKRIWRVNEKGYVVTGCFLALHQVILPLPPGLEVDHMNTNKLDNRRSNLRAATRHQNARNAGRRPHKYGHIFTSRFKGVIWEKRRKCWVARIFVDSKKKHAGYFKNEEDAGRAYDKAALKFYGEFARTNKMLGLL